MLSNLLQSVILDDSFMAISVCRDKQIRYLLSQKGSHNLLQNLE